MSNIVSVADAHITGKRHYLELENDIWKLGTIVEIADDLRTNEEIGAKMNFVIDQMIRTTNELKEKFRAVHRAYAGARHDRDQASVQRYEALAGPPAAEF